MTLELYEVVSVCMVVKCEDVDGSNVENYSDVVLRCVVGWFGGRFCWGFVVCDGGVCTDGGNGGGGV